MYRRTPHALAARWRFPPPSIFSFRSPGAAAAISDGSLGKDVSSSMTTSARASLRACSTAAASKALTRATAAPISARFRAPTAERVIPVTSWPRWTSSAMSGWPIAPLAPATKILMSRSFLGRDREFLGVAGVQVHRQHPGPALGARVAGHAMHDAALLVERLPGLQRLRRLLVESELELALHDIPDSSAYRHAHRDWAVRHSGERAGD